MQAWFTYFFILSFSLSAAGKTPKVLMMGDSVTNNIFQSARKAAKGKLDLHYVNPGTSLEALQNLKSLLGKHKWDVIYFNFGLNDLHYRAPGIKQFRAMSKKAGGVRQVSAKQYEKNLREIVKKLKQSGARLIFANTTPVPDRKYSNIIDPGSEVEFNKVAEAVMRQNRIPVIDMHSYVKRVTAGKKYIDAYSFAKTPLHEKPLQEIMKLLK